jgi:hypothetical protein
MILLGPTFYGSYKPMTYVSETVLIVAGHAWQCPACRAKLLEHPDAVLLRQGFTTEERKLLGGVDSDDWSTIGSLARAIGVDRIDLETALGHPLCRLRHL